MQNAYNLNFILLGLLAFFSVGCASTRQTDNLVKNRGKLPSEALIAEVPFIKQKVNHCGPASMAMVLKHHGNESSLEKITSQMYTEGMQGTFQSEMLSAARRQGMLTIPINDLESLLQEVASGNPVIVFQNVGLSFVPQWHYAVATGYDLDGPDIILHTGDDKFKKSDMRFFERTWKLAEYWGLLVLNPGQLSATASDVAHAKAAAFLEESGKVEKAKISYTAILKRWPTSLAALIGMGNVFYTEKNYNQSVKYLTQAMTLNPESAIVWHNLAIAQGAAGMKSEAQLSSQKAMSLVDEVSKENFQTSLKYYLNHM